MEEQRFARLMEYFKNEDNNIDFMVVFFFHSPPHSISLSLSLSRSPAEPPNNNNNDGAPSRVHLVDCITHAA